MGATPADPRYVRKTATSFFYNTAKSRRSLTVFPFLLDSSRMYRVRTGGVGVPHRAQRGGRVVRQAGHGDCGQQCPILQRFQTHRPRRSRSGKLIASPLKLPRSGEAFCNCLAMTTDRILMNAPGQPVLNVAELIEPPALSTTSLRTLAEGVAGMEPTLSARSTLAVNDWEARWASLQAESRSLLRLGTSIGSETTVDE